MTDARKKQLLAFGALAIAAGALGYIAFGDIEENLVYYWTPKELIAKGAQAKQATIRLGGLVQPGSMDWNPDTLELKFLVGVEEGNSPETVLVHAKETPPQMFREGIGVVVEGRYDGEVFHSDRLMVKHSNEYRAPEEGEKPSADTLVY